MRLAVSLYVQPDRDWVGGHTSCGGSHKPSRGAHFVPSCPVLVGDAAAAS